MGFLFILPLAALFLWILGSTFRALRRPNTPPAWWVKAWVLLAIGAALGVWFAFFTSYHPSPAVRLEGFPVPVSLERFQDGKWTVVILPSAIRMAGFMVDILGGMAVAWLPMKLACVLRQFREENAAAEAPRPPQV